jgi:predicted transcriptional regulator of viral defense system
MRLLDFFARHPVFTYDEFASFLDADAPRSVKTRDSLLAHHLKSGRILRVRRGLYVSVPFGMSPETFAVDPFLVAGKMADDSVLAYHTALGFQGKTHSEREEFLFLTSKAVRPLEFRGYRFRPVHFPKILVLKKKEFFAVNEVDLFGDRARVTSLERTLVDVLDRPSLGGGWEEIWRSLESVEFFDIYKVVDYTLLLGSSAIAAKTGFYLESHKDGLMLEDAHLKQLRDHAPGQPTYMDRSVRGRLVKGWNLVVPIEILDRTWEEIS